MYYYSIDSLQGRHLGFLVLMGSSPDEDARHCANGFFAVKAQAEAEAQRLHERAWKVLNDLSAQEALCWQKQADSLLLSTADGEALGRLQQQYLTLCGESFVLSDLDGTL